MSDSPRIDAHQHFWRFDAQDYPWMTPEMAQLRRDWLPQDLAPLLQAEGLDGCIAVQARASEEENVFLLRLAEAHPFVRAVVGWVDLFADDAAARLAYWRQHPRFCGVRHLLQDDPDVAATLADARFNAGVRAVQRQGLVYEVLVRGPAQLGHVAGFCLHHDAHWLILDHLGKPAIGGADEADWRRHLRRVAAQSHVLCKASGLVTEVVAASPDRDAIRRHLDIALEAFGAHRLMFGSDWPVCLLRAEYAEVAGIVRDWASELSAGEQAMLWGATAMRSYGVDAIE